MRKIVFHKSGFCGDVGQPSRGGFTLIELIVVISIIALLAALLVPALASSRIDSAAAKCMSNLRQVSVAWQMYDDVNRGQFPYNVQGSGTPNWIAGTEDYIGGVGDSNLNYMTNPTYAQLGPYVKNAAVFKCPSDLSRNYGTSGVPRIRSISMNAAIGFNGAGNTSGCGGWLPSNVANYGHGSSAILYKCYFKASDLGRPSPAGLFIFVEEHPDSINDAGFAFQMPYGTTSVWIDIPSKLHANACNFSFVDGHAEMHQWQMPQSIPNVIYSFQNPSSPGVVQITSNLDVWWVGNHTSASVDGQPNPFPGGN